GHPPHWTDVTGEQDYDAIRRIILARLQHEAFWIPILEALMEQGGSGRAADIIESVEQKLADVLNETDREPKPSNPNEPRWRNRANWARYYHDRARAPV